MNPLFLITKGTKAKKKRLGGGGGAPFPTNFGLLGKDYYSAGTTSGLTQSNLSLDLLDSNTGTYASDVAGVQFNHYPVQDYIAGTLRSLAHDSMPSGGSMSKSLTIPASYRNASDMALTFTGGIYNPNSTAIGSVAYTITAPIDHHGFFPAAGSLTNGNSVGITNYFLLNEAGNAHRVSLDFLSAGWNTPIALGELVLEVTATISLLFPPKFTVAVFSISLIIPATSTCKEVITVSLITSSSSNPTEDSFTLISLIDSNLSTKVISEYISLDSCSIVFFKLDISVKLQFLSNTFFLISSFILSHPCICLRCITNTKIRTMRTSLVKPLSRELFILISMN